MAIWVRLLSCIAGSKAATWCLPWNFAWYMAMSASRSSSSVPSAGRRARRARPTRDLGNPSPRSAYRLTDDARTPGTTKGC